MNLAVELNIDLLFEITGDSLCVLGVLRVYFLVRK